MSLGAAPRRRSVAWFHYPDPDVVVAPLQAFVRDDRPHYQPVRVDDHVRVTLDKLARQEEQSEGRIDALEQRVVSNVEESLAKRVATLEQATRDAVQKRVASVETRYMSRLGDVVAEKVEGSGRGWTLPFVVLVLVDVVAFVLAGGWYVRFKKSHLL